MPHGGGHGHGGGGRGRRFYGGGYYVDPYYVEDVIVVEPDAEDLGDAIDESAEGGDPAMSSGGPYDRMAELVAEHERYWSEITERHPDADIMRWWMSDRWSPFFVDWVDLVSHHGLSNNDVDTIAGVLRRLNGLRGEAQSHGIPIPREGAGTAISGALMGLTMSRPREMSIPEEINDETDRRFWDATGYKPGEKLDHHNPEDARMIPEWIRIRYQVALETAQRNEVPMHNNGSVFVGRGGASRRRGGGFGGFFGGDDGDPSLLDLAPVIAPGARGAHATIGFNPDTQRVSATVTVDGRTHHGHADLSQVMAEISGDVAGYHHALHGNPQAPAAIAGVANRANEAIAMCGDALVGTLLDAHRAEFCAGWFHNLENKIKGAVNKVTKAASHYALHPSDIARDVAGHLGAGKSLANALSYMTDPLQKITENPMVQQAAATYFGGPAGVAALAAAKSMDAGKFNVGDIAGTLKNFAPQIAQAAQGFAGNLGGPQAASLAGALVNATAGGGGAQALANQVVSAAETAAASDPQAKAVLDAAHQAVAQATVAHHVAQTVANAAAGNGDAQSQLSELVQAADQGDPAAAAVTDLAKGLGDVVSANNAAISAVTQGVADLRVVASKYAQDAGGTYTGIQLNPDLTAAQLIHFSSLDDADDWLAQSEKRRHLYLAIFDATDPTWPAPISESAGPEATHHVSGFLPMLLAAGAGAGAGYYFGPAIHEQLAKWFPKAFGAGSTKVSGHGGASRRRQSRSSQDGGDGGGGSDELLIASGVAVGSGDCGVRVFTGVDQPALDRIFQRLHDKGAEISGSNPWNVITHDHGVELHGTWDGGSNTLTLAVTDSALLAPCGAVWSALEDMLNEVGAHEVQS